MAFGVALLSGMAGGDTPPSGGVNTPTILGTPGTAVSSVETHTSGTHTYTVSANTEALVIITIYGPTNTGAGTETAPSSDLDGAFTEIEAADLVNGTGLSSNPRIGVWILESPTAAEHVVTRAISGDTLNYSGSILINLDDTDTGDIVGAFEVVRQQTDSNTFSSSITTERANSLIIAAAAWQGSDTDPFSKDHGFAQLIADFQTGAATTHDAAVCIATLTASDTPGAHSYGFTASSTDDHAYCAIEIRGADA